MMTITRELRLRFVASFMSLSLVIVNVHAADEILIGTMGTGYSLVNRSTMEWRLDAGWDSAIVPGFIEVTKKSELRRLLEYWNNTWGEDSPLRSIKLPNAPSKHIGAPSKQPARKVGGTALQLSDECDGHDLATAALRALIDIKFPTSSWM